MKWISLISENEGKTVSLGRISYWIALSFSIYFWFWLPVNAFPPTLFEFLAATLIFNLGKKAVSTTRSVFNKKYSSSMYSNPNHFNPNTLQQSNDLANKYGGGNIEK